MRVLITDRSRTGEALAGWLTTAGNEVSRALAAVSEPADLVVAAVAGASDVDAVQALRVRLPGATFALLARAVIPGIDRLEDPRVSVIFPAWGGLTHAGCRRLGQDPLLLPPTTIGPLAGSPRVVDRELWGALRRAGIRAVCRADMQPWLTVTSAWHGLMRGAVAAAARQGRDLTDCADLIALATWGARERLGVLRAAGFDLDARCWCLLALPRPWALQAVRSVAETLRRPSLAAWLPTAGEAAAVGRQVTGLARDAAVPTPAADFLDAFSFEEAEHQEQAGSGSGSADGCLPAGERSVAVPNR